MKRKRLSYDSWRCMLSKEVRKKAIDSDFFCGHAVLIDIKKVTRPQVWQFGGKEVTICDRGMKWLSMLPRNDFYCITAMLGKNGEVLLWYIDMIAAQGTDPDGMPYFDDLYLDLVASPDGTVAVDDMDELEEALENHDISKAQFDLAVKTCEKLQNGLLKNLDSLKALTKKCYEEIKSQKK